MLDADERLFPVTKSYLSHEMIRGFKNTGIKAPVCQAQDKKYNSEKQKSKLPT